MALKISLTDPVTSNCKYFENIFFLKGGVKMSKWFQMETNSKTNKIEKKIEKETMPPFCFNYILCLLLLLY